MGKAPMWYETSTNATVRVSGKRRTCYLPHGTRSPMASSPSRSPYQSQLHQIVETILSPVPQPRLGGLSAKTFMGPSRTILYKATTNPSKPVLGKLSQDSSLAPPARPANVGPPSLHQGAELTQGEGTAALSAVLGLHPGPGSGAFAPTLPQGLPGRRRLLRQPQAFGL